MSLLRTFIAIELPVSLQDSIHSQTAGLRQSVDGSLVRWTPVNNIHLTLKFLGDVSPGSVDLLAEMVKREAGEVPCFEVQVAGLGAFPNQRRPRVIWIGVSAPPALETLQHGIEMGAARLGYDQEARGFSPHLTIGRVRQDHSTTELQKVRTALEITKVGDCGRTRVESVEIFKSDLKPTGSVYTRLFSTPLRKDAPVSESSSH